MSIFEYDEEAVKQAWREDAYEDGKIEGIIEMGLDFDLSESAILEKLQQKMQISPEKAQEYVAMFRGSPS